MISTQPCIGLFGGSFDPPHLGHHALVMAGLELLGLEEVWVIPALPVHRRLSGRADGERRLDWLERMFADEPRVRVWDAEIRRGRPTAMVETLRQFAAERAVIPWLMLGADAWAGLPGWVEYPAHRGLCNLAVFARRGVSVEALLAPEGWRQVGLKECRQIERPGHLVFVPVELPEISATALRADLAAEARLADRIPATIRREVLQAYAQ